MKTVLFGAILAFALVGFSGCSSMMGDNDGAKCGSGKCGASHKTAKCGSGKCGDSKKEETAKKCGSGKCGSSK